MYGKKHFRYLFIVHFSDPILKKGRTITPQNKFKKTNSQSPAYKKDHDSHIFILKTHGNSSGVLSDPIQAHKILYLFTLQLLNCVKHLF